jgi:hypothetical protein
MRRLLPICALLSSALLAAVVGLWIRVGLFNGGEYWEWTRDEVRQVAIYATPTALTIKMQGIERYVPRAPILGAPLPERRSFKHGSLANEAVPAETDAIWPRWTQVEWAFYQGNIGPGVVGVRKRIVAVPIWMIFVATSVLPIAWLRRRRRRRRLRSEQRCPACGYDIRASPERCPECGAGVESGT